MSKSISLSRVIYIIGSLRNSRVPIIANELRKDLGPNTEIFDSWYSPGPHADDYWRKYEKAKGLSYKEAINSWAAKHIFEFDRFHLDRATDAILIAPAGKSCHLELGYFIGQGKRGYIFFDKEPKRWDVMTQFATDIFFDYNELRDELLKYGDRARRK